MNVKFFPLGVVDANCCVLCTEDKQGAVIDPGSYNAVLEKAIRESGIERLKYIICTHGHFDHTSGVGRLKEKYPEATVVVCEPDAPALYDSFLSGAAVFGLELYPCKADKCVNDGDTLSFGKSEISVIATPGHTLGSAVFYIESENLAFTGDTLFKNSVGRTDLYGGSYPQLMNSLKKLKKLPPETVLICGHGESTTMERELMYNSYLV